jgi:hypothetical protein
MNRHRGEAVAGPHPNVRAFLSYFLTTELLDHLDDLAGPYRPLAHGHGA